MVKNRFWKRYEERLITIKNRESVTVEGCEKIILCEKDKIILRGACDVEVTGKELTLSELGNDVVSAVGKVENIRFSERGKNEKQQ